MNELFTGIYNKYAAGGDLYDALYVDTEYVGLYLDNAPQEADFPFCVYGLVSRNQDYNFSDEMESVLVYFNIYTETGQTHAGTLLGNLTSMFDDTTLTVSGYRHIYMLRDVIGEISDIDRDPPIYAYHVEYEVLIEKAR